MSEMTNDHETSDEHENAGRRRLVRGAVAFAPLVLTLRSGGLAAASAGAAVIAFANVDKQGNIQITSTPNGSTAKVADVCVRQYVNTQNGRISASKDNVDPQPIASASNGNLVCGSFKAPQQGSTQIQVAILSSSSTGSL